MTINFSVDPYNDDFDSTKNFHRILFKPGVAVQARELTQSQTILQDQIQKFGDHVFKNHTIVSGAQCNVNQNVFYVKIKPVDRNNEEVIAANFVGKTVEDATGTIVGKVVSSSEKVLNADGTLVQSPLLIISYASGSKFSDGQRIYVRGSADTVDVITTEDTILLGSSTGESSIATITQGVFYIDGFFVGVAEQTTIIEPFTNLPSARVGISITENIVSAEDDFSLLDPALGASNFQAPGADRYQIKLSLTSKSLILDGDPKFIELIKIEEGKIQKTTYNTYYSILDNYFARRTFDTNGDFVVDRFKISAVQPAGSNNSSNTFSVKVGPGKAYVRGYLVENQSDMNFTSNKSRANNSVVEKAIYMNYGNQLNIYNANGFFDFVNFQQVDFHSIKTPNTSNLIAYNSTKVGSGKIRNIEFDSYGDVSNNKTFVYKSYVIEVQTNSVTGNAVAVTTNTLKLPSGFNSTNDIYAGVSLRINTGDNAGDVVVVANNSANLLYVSPDFTRVPESNCNFSLLYDTKDIESLYASNTSGGIGWSNNRALVANSSKVSGLDSGDVFFLNVNDEELIYDIGDYIVQNSFGNTEYYSKIKFKDINPINPFSVPYPDTALFTLSDGDYYTNVDDNFICVVRQGNGSFTAGDILAFNSPTLGIRISSDSSQATIIGTNATNLTGAVIDVYAQVWVKDGNYVNISRRTKQLVSANTTAVKNFVSGPVIGKANTFVDLDKGHTYINKDEFTSNNQSLYVSDVKSIIKVLDTKNPDVNASVEMISSSVYDITRYFSFNSGQNDFYYDHATISLLPNAPTPNGNILVLYDYYKHLGDGYFNVDSYPDSYEYIPTYFSKKGKAFALKDCVDFRRTRVANTTNFELSYSESRALSLPVDQSNFNTDYSYYLGRKDIIIITKDKEISLLEGIPAINPTEPNVPEGAIVIARLTHEPYTSFVPSKNSGFEPSSIQINPVEHKRWRMEDISSLEDRVSRVEYYTSLNTLEQNAQNLQIPDELGLNRFKNGIITDNFTSYKVADISNPDFKSSIQPLKRKLFATHTVKNFSLVLKDCYKTAGKLDPSIANNLSYKIETEGSDRYVCLPYTKKPAAVQQLASRTVNVNPYYFVSAEGVCYLNPPMDNWISESRLPDILIVDPDTNIYQQSNTLNVLKSGDWQTISTTKLKTDVVTNRNIARITNPTNAPLSNFNAYTDQQLVDFMNVWGVTNLAPNGLSIPFASRDRTTIITRLNAGSININGRTTRLNSLGVQYNTSTVTTDTFEDKKQREVTEGYYSEVKNNTLQLNDGFVTDVSLNPYIRGQELEFSCRGLLYNTEVSAFFDGTNVSDRIIQPNIIDLDVDPDFVINTNDIVGYYNGSRWVPAAKIIDVQTSNNIIGKYRTLVPVANEKIRIRCSVIGDKKTRRYKQVQHPTLKCDVAILNFDTTGNVSSASVTANVANIIRKSGEILEVKIDETSGETKLRIPEFYAEEYNDYDDEANTVPRFIGKNVTCMVNDWEGNFEITYTTRDSDHPVYGNTIFLWCNNSIISTNNIVGSSYTIKPITSTTGGLKTNEEGALFGVFYLPDNEFNTGEKVFRIDNSLVDNEGSETCYAQAKFFASSLNKQKQGLDFSVDLGSVDRVFSRTETQYNNRLIQQTQNRSVVTASFAPFVGGGGGGFGGAFDPLAQTFQFFGDTYPYGCFIKSVKLFFRTKPATDDQPVYVYIIGTENGYPNGSVLPHGVAVLKRNEIKVSESPHYLDPNSYSEFVFNVPVYVKPEVYYSFMVYTNTNEYTLYTANLGDDAIPSTARNSLLDPLPTEPQRITKTPYTGSLFLSQNTLTWTADQNQDLMFVIERCDFDTTKTPKIEFFTPKHLLQRPVVSDSIAYINSEDSVIDANSSSATSNSVLIDALNLSTTDLTFENAPISYTYRALLNNNGSPERETYETSVNPGKYGTVIYDDIYFDDGKGERLLDATRDDSFSMYASLRSYDPTISPFISEAGVSLYSVTWDINNLSLSNTDISILSSGNSYTSNPILTVSKTSNTGGTTAVLSANVVNGQIVGVDVISPGSLYATNPIITIVDDNHRNSDNANAVIVIAGESSSRGGIASDRYILKPVILNEGFDAGDLRVYYTAYRPLGTNIYMYYKILNRNDTQDFDDSDWMLMTVISGADTYSKTRADLFEFIAAPGTFGNPTPDNKVSYVSKKTGQVHTTFYKFAIKIVFATSDKTVVPFLTDIRGIALPELV